MRIERDDDAPSIALSRLSGHLVNDLPVSPVHPVERPNRHDGVRILLRLGKRTDDLHRACFCSPALYRTSSSIDTASASRYSPILVRVRLSRYAPHPSCLPMSSARVRIYVPFEQTTVKRTCGISIKVGSIREMRISLGRRSTSMPLLAYL